MPGNTYLLVLTACVDPSAGSYRLERADATVRLADYQEGLRFWLHYADRRIDKILFIENSGYPLDSLEEIVRRENTLGKKVEFVSLNCNEYPPAAHYGYAEMRMLDLGLQQSTLRPTVSHLIKVTGRLKFPALRALLDRVPEGFDVVADARVWRTPWAKHQNPFVATQLLAFTYAFYRRYLEGTYGELEVKRHWIESLYFEKIFAAWQAAGDKSKILLRFPCNVDPVGQPAHRQRSYTHPLQRLINLARAVLRRIAPFWWI